jgi:hypothetical protein
MTIRTVRALVVVWLLMMAASAEAATVTLAWDRNTDPSVQGYIVSYGTQSGTYTTAVDVGDQVTWSVVLNPSTTTTYFFAVQAYNATGTSAYSTEVSTVVVPSQSRLTIDAPAAGSVLPADLLLSGWAVDTASTTGTGIDAIHVYAYPNPGSGAAPLFLGLASYGGSRPDVGAVLGDARYSSSGYTLPIVGLTPGVWQLTVYAHSTVSGDFAINRSTRITVYSPTAAPAPTGETAAIGVPVMNSTVTSWLSVGGWAVDVRSPTGPGVDVVQVWAYPNPGSGSVPLFLGNAPYGRERADVAALFGSRFLNSGFHIDVMGMAAGMYDIVVLPRSTVSGAFEVARVSRVMIDPSVLMTVDSPATNSTVSSSFTLSGWALDRRATLNGGVDLLHVWAYPNPGSGTAPLWLGVAVTGLSRPDVGAAFGSQYSFGGFSLPANLAPGLYEIVLFAHSTVSNTFENARVVRITVQ